MANRNGAELESDPAVLADAADVSDIFSVSQQDKQSSSAASDAPRHLARRDYIREGFVNKTKGESLFNHLVYGGVGFGIVTGVSILMTYVLRDNPHGSKWYSKLVTGVQDKLKGNRTGEQLEAFKGTVDSAMTIGALFTGGTIATVLPVKALEDNKAPIVKALDTRIYGADRVASDPDIKAAHDEIDIAPRQTWRSVFASRVVAFIATFSVWGAVGANTSPLAKKLGGSIDSLSIKAGRTINKTLQPSQASAISHMQQHHPVDMHRTHNPAKGVAAADSVSTRIWNYVVQDGLYTALTSVSLFISTRVLGPIFDKPHEHKAGEAGHGAPSARSLSDTADTVLAESTPERRDHESERPTAKVDSVTRNSTVSASPNMVLGAS